jgi:hypothetical protein
MNYERDGALVPARIAQQKAREVTAERNISESVFPVSATWLSLFLRRLKLSLRSGTRKGQIRPEDTEQVKIKFAKEVNEKMAELGI